MKSDAPERLPARVAAVRALIPEPGHVISSIEDRLGTRYTIDIIRHLTMRHPQVQFVWIMGADSLGGFHRWGHWREIARRVPICVIARGGSPLKWRLGKAARQLAPRPHPGRPRARAGQTWRPGLDIYNRSATC